MEETVRRLFPVLGALLFSQAALAQQNSHTLEFSTQFFSFNYSEVWPAPQKSDEYGFVPGLALAYTYRGDALPLFARLSFEYTSSLTNYEGDLNNADGTFVPLANNTQNWFRRFELDGGYAFRLAHQFTLTPYTGYGYRSWTRALSDPGGYREGYGWSYIPVGVRGDLQIGRTFMLGLNAALRFMFGGTIAIDGVADNPTMDLGNKVGGRFALPANFRISQHWGIELEPWYEFSGISEGDRHLVAGTIDNYIWEPESSTSIFGTNLTVLYGF